MRSRSTLALLTAGALFARAAVAPLAAQTYTSPAAFAAAAGVTTYTETFESVPVAKNTRVSGFTQGGIRYTGQNGAPFPNNVVVTPPGATEYGPGLNPTTTSILTASGNENIFIEFLTASYAVGLDTYYNGLGTATATFYNGSTILGSIAYNGAAAKGFNGYVAGPGAPITAMRWLATGGGTYDTGIDNLTVSTTAVVATPEPASVIMVGSGIVVFGLTGAVRRRNERSASGLETA